MNLAGRINRLEEVLGSYELFGGATLVDVSRFGYFTGDRDLQSTAPARVRRLVIAGGLLIAITTLTRRPDSERAAELREMLGLYGDFTTADILGAVTAQGEEARLRPKELDWLRAAARSRLGLKPAKG